MKRFIALTIGLIGLLLLTGCRNGTNDGNADQPYNIPTTPYVTQTPDPITEAPNHRTLEELGATIVATGVFWNKWWASHHTFEWEHIDDSRQNWQPWDETITPAHHPLSRGFAILLPSSGFTSLNDIGAYLSQFYSQAWIDAGIFVDPLVTMQTADGTMVQVFGIGGFEEYDGEPFLFIQTEMSLRPDWRTATHTLIEQDGNRAVVETVVPTYIHGYSPDYEMPTIIYRFYFVDGKIDNASGGWVQANDTLGASHEHTLEDFVATITAAGEFWGDWWGLRGRFAPEHLQGLRRVEGTDEFIDTGNIPPHLLYMFDVLLPSSGFENFASIRNYLLRFYTEEGVRSILSDDSQSGHFTEYDGRLFIMSSRLDESFPYWQDATHRLVEQSGSRAVVESTVRYAAWDLRERIEHIGTAFEIIERTYRFTLIDGRIDESEVS